ncbi:aryl-sulfate sulfotransferase [Desulfovibrio sp. UCD-KL4C]|uniref:aryl-sulfate sulfotransferase n=1 Tax=Desulfovibrio sp. UCD-KL4C TaxID=2578120 RepID=UPI0025BB343D|nr:aryl-sulfate sulfotransferase [Desulfovibrio sp. UCD-KL4C]
MNYNLPKVSYERISHLVTQQNESEAAFMKQFAEEECKYDNPLLVVNPYLINPLTAVLLFRTEKPVGVTITVRGVTSVANITKTFPPATEHVLPILGLYKECDNIVDIELSTGEKSSVIATTGGLPELTQEVENIITTPEYMEGMMMFVSAAGKSLPAGYDYNGDCRWAMAENFVFDMKRAANGNLLMGSYRYSRPPYHTTGLCEVTMVGKIVKEYRLPGNYHHDQFEMKDGNLLILTQDFHRETVEDMLVLVDRETGDILKTWDIQGLYPMDVGKSGSWSSHDWFHCNAVWYDKPTNSLTLSGRHQDIIINIDYETGELNWMLGDPEGWPEELVEKYFFTPVGDLNNFDWQYEQHSCLITPDGDVMCFDNGHWRSKKKENYRKNKDNFSRGVRYRINTDKMEIEQIWQFGKERGQHFYSPYICNVECYANDHYMVHSGGIGYVDGMASEKLLPAFLDPEDPSHKQQSVTVEVKNDVVMFEMHLPSQFYRAEKLSLYHDGDNMPLGKGKVLGYLDVTPEFDTVPETEETSQPPSEWYKIKIVEEEDRFTFSGRFEKGCLLMLCLENEQESHNYYISTTARPALAMCVGSFMEADDRQISLNVSKLGFSGIFAVKVIINEKKYHTGICITVD